MPVISTAAWADGSRWANSAGTWRDALDKICAVVGTMAMAAWVHAVLLEPGEASGERAGRGEPVGESRAQRGTAETLIGGYVGLPYTHASDLKFVNPGKTNLTVHDVQWEGRPFKSPIYYGLRAARWSGWSPFGTMVDFTHSKAIAIRDQTVRFSGERNGAAAPGPATVGNTFKHMEFSHGHNMLTLNGLWRLWPATAPVVPYVGAGGGINLPHTEVQFLDEPDRTYEYQYTGPIGQALAGIEIRLPGVSLFVEYKFTLARYEAPLTGRDSRFSYGPDDFWVQFVDWWGGVKPKYGTVATTLVSHQVIGGAAWRRSGAAVTP